MAFYSLKVACNILLYFFIVYLLAFHSCAYGTQMSILLVNATSNSTVRRIPDNFFGVFLEEINHGVSGGLWAELVNNILSFSSTCFEAGHAKSSIYPWSIIGDNSSISVSTDLTSCFEKNKVALQMQVLCGDTKPCPSSGVGISNPGFWGMNIEKGKKYKIIYYVKAMSMTDLETSFTGAGDVKLALFNVNVSNTTNWTRIEKILEANATYHNASLQITTTTKGVYWLDQVSAMPVDTHKGNGFRNDLFQMVAELKPKFLRFPGGTFVEGISLKNAVRWKNTVGPWEERPGHLNDVWKYWTDDGFGYFEGLQLAEDLNALPVWVFNAGIYIFNILSEIYGIEFARGSASSKWGSIRAAMGHPKPFNLRYVAIGNEDCGKKNYLIIHDKIKSSYSDIKIISNCDGSVKPINQTADLFDFHIYTNSTDMFKKSNKFDKTSRSGPKAFISEYAVWKKDAALGSLVAAVAEAAFLIGLEKNRWIPDAIVFNSYQYYGTPSYWVQKFFTVSSGTIFLPSTLKTDSPDSIIASAINLKGSKDNENYIRLKVVNIGSTHESLQISISRLKSSVKQHGSTKTVLTSSNLMDENSFLEPNKVVPHQSSFEDAAADMNILLPPYSVTSLDLLI
ncbi:hypothetical protein Lal_00030341 [Lupinus albus]|nr:hypothetical protein Lal_00030341 [Lupinus albus]